MSGATESESGDRPGATVNGAVSAELLAATARDRFPTLSAMRSALATALDVDPDSVRVIGENDLTQPRWTAYVADLWEARLPESACDWLGVLLPDDVRSAKPITCGLTATGAAVVDLLRADSAEGQDRDSAATVQTGLGFGEGLDDG